MAEISNEKIETKHILSWHANLPYILSAEDSYGKCSIIYKSK